MLSIGPAESDVASGPRSRPLTVTLGAWLIVPELTGGPPVIGATENRISLPHVVTVHDARRVAVAVAGGLKM